MPRSTRRATPGVNAGSMADIAFLLLIFFLVTTKIEEDQGVLVRLPEWIEDVQPPKTPHALTVTVNFQDRLLVENEEVDVSRLPELLVEHINDPSRKPTQAVVSLNHDRSTGYRRYLEVYNALLNGYNRIWNTEADRRYGRAFAELSDAEKKAVRKAYPMVISEAEPKDHKDNRQQD